MTRFPPPQSLLPPPPLRTPLRRRISQLAQQPSEIASTTSTPAVVESRLHAQPSLSLDYFTDPSPWADDRKNKKNPKPPYFRHKSTNELLWIERWHNPDRVKQMLETREAENDRSQRSNEAKPYVEHAKREQSCSNFKDPCLVHKPGQSTFMSRASFSPAHKEDASISQQRMHGSGWEMLGREAASRNLDQLANVHSFEDFIYILRRGRENKNLAYSKLVHSHICNNGLESHKYIGNYIVSMFVECGSVSDAQNVFNKLVHRNERSWTSLILGYIRCRQPQHALNLYQTMQESNISPSRYTLMALVKACARLKNVERGRETHIEIRKKGFDKDLFVGNSLVDMYSKCGSLSEARGVFDKLPVRDVVSWTALIAGFTEYGTGQEALKCFEQMQREGISPDAVTFACILKACASIGAIDKGREIHMEVKRKGIERDLFVGGALVDMYAKCGSLSEGRDVLNNLPARDVVSWTALIAGYAEHGPYAEALICFEQMQLEGVIPNAVTFVCGLKACGNIGVIDKGREMHMKIAEMGLEREIFVGNTLVNMYAKCGSLSEACDVFEKLPTRDVVSWNALIAGYAEHGPCQEALKCFEQMQLEGISPDNVSFVCALKACGRIGAIHKGRKIHAEIAARGFERDLVIGSSLLDMYAKCGSFTDAEDILNNLPARDVVSWNALISGYAEHGCGQEVLNCFERMQLEGVLPDVVTFVCVLKACGSIGAIDKGREIHREIFQRGFENSRFVGNTLVDMYAKCGSLLEARRVFNKMAFRDIISWSAMINGYGMNHEAIMALQCFEDMQEQGVKANATTFTCLLTACSHASLVVQGQEYFEMMRTEYGIVPTVDHYTCIIDLLGRSGHLYEADRFLASMPCSPSIETWTALLSACKIYRKTDLGWRCFQQLVQINPQYATSYGLMASIYTCAGMQDDAYRIEELRKHCGAKKKPASAWIEVNKKVHEFMLRDNQGKEIAAMLQYLNSHMKKEGHVTNVDLVLRPVSHEEKETTLCEHVETLALAFGLLNTPQGQTLHMSKNMRMCKNCHDSSKIISGIERREIIVRDGYSVHHFKDGFCSCVETSYDPSLCRLA